ncbi:vitamin K-dependent protein S isoform X1 [Electrophorus electricus]|uniref:vitamin K-dependent protein S isoform X1 n=1 Tax=Electrophorus electricus TaxID=8005 RepID=UPI0015D0AA93|nr:vitamin K-dependent protein S isoform X1 [Electrophorus electricus]
MRINLSSETQSFSPSDQLFSIRLKTASYCKNNPPVVFRVLAQSKASQFLTRHRRANSLFEERKKGNLERECVEELCSKEEAREIFENIAETDYFYPKYVECLGSHRVGITNSGADSEILQDLRSCVKEITDQCQPLPCHKHGYERCLDGHATYTCMCKPGWTGMHCEEDINECEDPEFLAGCNHKCFNVPGSFRCTCEDGFYLKDNIHCLDINECRLYPSICKEPAKCVNTPGAYECQCPKGYKYNFTSHECQDLDECEQNICEFDCTNTLGSYSCQCDGRVGLKLSADGHTCETIPVCVPLYDHKHGEMLYLGEQFTGGPVIYLRFRLPLENSRFAVEFDFRTFDPEGVMLYAESLQDSWFMLGLRGGRIEVQLKNQHSVKVTSGGRAINDGLWHVISVEELEKSISVKLSKEAVLSISSPGSLFGTTSGKLDTKVYIAGLPNRNTSLIKQINPRLDGCIRGWNLLNQGTSGVKEVIQEKESKHCFVYVERGSFFTGAGPAYFNIDYSRDGQWTVDVEMGIRPSSSTGVLFTLVTNNTVPLSVTVVTQGSIDADLQVFLDGILVATLQSLMLCYPEHLVVRMQVTANSLQLSANSSKVSYADAELLGQALATLNTTMQQPVDTYIGGLPDLPLSATPVSAYYHGCIMEIRVNKHLLDFDEAVSKHNSIKSHSCPPVHPPEPPGSGPGPAPARK